MKLNNSLKTEGLNQAIENSKKSKTNNRMSKIATVIMAAMMSMSLTACGGTTFDGTPKEAASSIKVIDKDASFNVIGDVLEAELGVVETDKTASNIDAIFDNKVSSAELYIKTPENNLDFVYNNESQLSVGEIICNFKDFLANEDKTDKEFKEVTDGKVTKTDSYALNKNENGKYSIFEDIYLLRYNQTDRNFSIFLLEHTLAFSDYETSESKYTSTPETRTDSDTNLEYSSLPLPKTLIK